MRIAVFDISDIPLINAIKAAADRAGQKYIYMLLDAGQLDDIQANRPWLRSHLRDLQAHPRILIKQSHGRTSGIAGRMHIKLFCTQTEVIICSHNYTAAARTRNSEIMTRILDRAIVRKCLGRFYDSWVADTAQALDIGLSGIIAVLPDPSEVYALSELGSVYNDTVRPVSYTHLTLPTIE